MKRLKLFPQIFIYTLVLMLSITFLASGMIYLLAPIMVDNSNVLSPGTLTDNLSEIGPIAIPRNAEITKAIVGSLPYTIGICVVVSLVCALLFSRAFIKPIKHILNTTAHMETLEINALCKIQSYDEIGILSNRINELYHKLLSTIEHLKEEKDRVSEAERQKVDFLRVASHELKTPVTSLNAMLENMIMEVGKYQDYNTYLPLCKEQTEKLSKMITEILDTSKMGMNIENEKRQTLNIAVCLLELCSQYQLIAQANGQIFKLDLPHEFTVCLPLKMFSKALSNILANAVAYTAPGKTISVCMNGRMLIIENECQPILEEHLKHVFEPFYRPDYARNRKDGGNGLGLYIVATILDSLNFSYSFCPIDEPKGMRFIINL